uniref:Uncharacterized protein n=1 Tax=Mustela putorius furo TaxID=9669 RepID=M3XT95_MUSPF
MSQSHGVTPPPTQTRGETRAGLPRRSKHSYRRPRGPTSGCAPGRTTRRVSKKGPNARSRRHRSHHARQGGDPGVRGRVRGEAQEGSPDTSYRVDGPGRRHTDSRSSLRCHGKPGEQEPGAGVR